MRKIKFRGRITDTKEWVCGSLIIYPDGEYNILTSRNNHSSKMDDWRIDADTVGQFTGLHDKNGKEIYEGDILFDYDFNEMVEVEYEEQLGAFILDKIPTIGAVGYIGSKDTELYCEIIGNIHDNPELMKGGTE